MNAGSVVMARVYLHESQGKVNDLMRYLHDEAKVKGVTVFRGISGYGTSGRMHSATLVDMSLDLPVVVEFFDTPERMQGILDTLQRDIKPGHLVSWDARVNAPE